MGNSHSAGSSDAKSPDQVYHELTRRFEVNFDTLELESIRKTFYQLSTPVSDLSIWSEDTFVKFLGLPDGVGSLLFLSASYVASYPYTHESPSIITCDALVRVIGIMTGRTETVMDSSARLNLIYNSFAVHENNIEKQTAPEVDKQNDQGLLAGSRAPVEAETQNPDTGLRVRKDDLRKLLQFLLSLQEKSNVEVVANYIERLGNENAKAMASISRCIVNTISENDTITFQEIQRFMYHSPSLLSTLPSLYAHFLYPAANPSVLASKKSRPFKSDNLLNDNSAAQLSLFLPEELIFGKLDQLYRASRDGFSMGAFETKVLRYPGPTLLILNGSTKDGAEASFGIFSNVPWKQSSKETFGDSKTTLFQLAPLHKVFKRPELNDGTWFAKSLGIGIGCIPPSLHTKSHDFGGLSLVVDTSLEYATFRHESVTAIVERIEIREVEVWGLGGDREAQRKAWEWEEMEANRRRTVNIKDMQADYGT